MRNFRSPHRTAGFSLVEVMVGLLIGMLAIIVIMQVFSVSEGNKRATTGGDDAQNDGAIALYGLQRDLKQSGLGASSFQVVGCNVQLRAGVTLNGMGPVTINHAALPASAADTGTDSLLIMYGNGNGSDEGERIEAQPSQNTYTVASAASAASGVGAFSVADKVIVEAQPRPSPCNLQLAAVNGITAANVAVAGAGVAGVSGGIIYNLGQAPRVLVYAVQRGSLTVCDYMVSDCGAAGNVGNTAVWVPIASNIVSMRAEYGQDTTAPAMDGTVDSFDQSTPTTACQWARVSAVRLALVARSAQYDKNEKRAATASAPQWASSSAAIDLSSYADWQHYRYKLFQTVVPIRNVAWQGVQPGC